MGNILDRKIKNIKKNFTRKAALEFEAAIAGIVDNVVLKNFIKAIEERNIGKAIAALDIDETTTAKLSEILAATFNEVGIAVASGTIWRRVDYQKVVVRWNIANPRANRILQEQSSRLVTRVSEGTKDVIANALRGGFEQGKGPRSLALDVVGRIGANGRRVGGIVGLTGPQAEYVNNMRRRLETGNISEVKNMSKRDHRFDKTLNKHIMNGTRPSKTQINKMVSRYSARLLKLRGDNIARTETASSVLSARQEAFEQWQQKTGVPDKFVLKTWDHIGGGKKNRDGHQFTSGQKVVGLNTAFVVPSKKSGTVLMKRPLDTSLGAGASDVINCTCDYRIRIDHAGILKANG